jgi:TonB family protein
MQTLERTLSAPSFASLPDSPSRLAYFSVSCLVQAALLVALAKTSISLVAPIFNPVDLHDNVHLVAIEWPASPPPAPPPMLKEPAPPRPVSEKLEPRLLKQQPTIQIPKQNRKIEVTEATRPVLPAPASPTIPESVSRPKLPRVVGTTNFGGTSAPATANKPERQVQTGGFGDPNGAAVNPGAGPKGPVIAKVGSFDLPQGAGSGNGRGGTKGVPSTVASAGFGNGIATQNGGGSGGNNVQGGVRPAGFGSVEPPPMDVPKRQVPAATAKDAPVSLLSKPMPSYTPAARQRKIEGDVELDVEFTATGQVHVLRVLQGLGYGLDEAAVKAAEQIRFTPALHDGRPVDSHGRLRVVFRLS